MDEARSLGPEVELKLRTGFMVHKRLVLLCRKLNKLTQFLCNALKNLQS